MTIARVASTSRMCSDSTSDAAKNACLEVAAAWPSASAAARARLSAPNEDPHSKRVAVPGDDAADPSVAVDPERLASHRMADADLPVTGLERRHLGRQLPHRREHERPRQLGRGVGRRVRVQIGGHDDSVSGAGINVDVGIDAALADQPQGREPLDQRGTDGRALADQDERVERREPLRQRVDRLDVIGEHGHVMCRECGEARQRAERVEVVVEDRDVHGAEVGRPGEVNPRMSWAVSIGTSSCGAWPTPSSTTQSACGSQSLR